MPRSRLALAVPVILVGVTITGCADGGRTSDMPGMGHSSSPQSSAKERPQANDFNDADVAFATSMIPHHRQAVEMAELAESRARSSQVKELALKIKGAQDPEIQAMTGWLNSWGRPVPGDMSGMDMSGAMPGMMSINDMQTLTKAEGADFDRLFLTMMIAHHRGAIEMAQDEQAQGRSAEAVGLARRIEAAQTEEIARMQQMLG